jgi:hypothetical protein
MALKFRVFDVYRVLRPRGLFGIDHFVFPDAQMNAMYAPILEHVD